MNGKELKKEFRAIAIKKSSYDFRMNHIFTLREVISIIDWYLDKERFQRKQRLSTQLEKTKMKLKKIEEYEEAITKKN